MMREKTTYNLFKTLFLLKHWVVFCLLLFLAAKPIVTVTALFADVRYEFMDTSEKDTTEEKEDVMDNEESEKFYNTSTLSIDNYLKQSLSYDTTQKQFLDVNPAIYLPPPKLS